MSEQWGPWIEHDGMHIPDGLIGKYIMVKGHNDVWGIIVEMEGVVRNTEVFLDYDLNFGPCVIRYRIRKPKGLSILQDILREVEDIEDMEYNERREKENVK